MSVLPLASLLVHETKEAIYTKGLEIADAVGLPVTSWTAGDPTRSLYHLVSEILATVEDVVVVWIGAAFLDYAEGDWLHIKAQQDFNVDFIAATYASTDVTLTNAGGGLYVLDVGDL